VNHRGALLVTLRLKHSFSDTRFVQRELSQLFELGVILKVDICFVNVVFLSGK
jgi:hypothetical protein